MKKIRLLVLTLMLVSGFSGLVQFRIPVALANSCESNPFPECNCSLIDSVSVQWGNQIRTTCTYGCSCPGSGGGGHFYIERTAEYFD